MSSRDVTNLRNLLRGEPSWDALVEAADSGELIDIAKGVLDEHDRMQGLIKRTIDYIPMSPIECHGDKCREPWCRSCFDEENVQAAMDAARETLSLCRSALYGTGDG